MIALMADSENEIFHGRKKKVVSISTKWIMTVLVMSYNGIC